MRIIIILAPLLSILGCSTTGSFIPVNNSFPPKQEDCPLKVVMPGQELKKDSTLIGTYSAQETGFSVNCGWDDTLEKNKKKACDVGADIIQFIEVNTPSISSTCYTTKANFLKRNQ